MNISISYLRAELVTSITFESGYLLWDKLKIETWHLFWDKLKIELWTLISGQTKIEILTLIFGMEEVFSCVINHVNVYLYLPAGQ